MQALPVGEISATPWSFSPLWFGLLAVGVPALVWLGCAWWRALQEDPNRIRRKGVKELRRVLRNVRRSHGLPQPHHLHAWLRASARTWGVRVSAPTANEVRQAMASITDDGSVTSRWCDLWHMTERSLFAANASPAQDWLERASTAVAQIRMPRRERLFPNRRAHWLPPVAAFVLVVSAAAVPQYSSAQEDGPAIGDEAAFRDAHDTSRQALGASWNDWAAHYNVAGLQMHEGNWSLAIAHATAAFLQNPSSAEVREALRVALGQTENPDPRLRRMLSGAWHERIPALMSAADWQRMGLAAGVLLAAGLAAFVLALYFPAYKRALSSTGRGAAALGALLFIVSVTSWNAYGTMSAPDAAMLLQRVNVRPAPTDLVPEAESTPAAAGNIVVLRRSFLGWKQVVVSENFTGWVRRNAVMPFYARP